MICIIKRNSNNNLFKINFILKYFIVISFILFNRNVITKSKRVKVQVSEARIVPTLCFVEIENVVCRASSRCDNSKLFASIYCILADRKVKS